MKKIHPVWIPWLFFSFIITILIVNGIFFPYHGKHGAGLLDLLTFKQMLFVIGPIFAYLAFLGTATKNHKQYIKNKKINFALVLLIRLILTFMHCFAAFVILFFMIFVSCAFGAGECCC